MKKTIIILGMLMLCLSFGVANATPISDPWVGNTPEQNLYFVYNTLLGTSFANSNAIPQLAQPGPWSAGKWDVNVVVKFAGLTQTLGTSASGDLHTQAANGTNFLTGIGFTAPGTFTWYDKTTIGIQDSDSAQFVAFQLTQGEGGQIDYLNENFGTTKDINGLVYLIGFEDTPTGDRDFNDLMAIVENLGQGSTVPEPATMLLLGSGLLGMGVYARRRFKK